MVGCKKDDTAAGTTGDATTTTGGTTGMSSGSSATTAPSTTGEATGGTTGTSVAGLEKVTGDWIVVLPQEAIDMAKKSNQPLPTGTMTITGDGKFKLVMKSADKTFEAEGDAKMDGSKLSITATKLDGKAPATEADKKPQELSISDDGSTLTSTDGSKMTFKKKA
jgi:hypothetical protein